MKRDHGLQFDSLEGRRLLSGAHAAHAAHAARAAHPGRAHAEVAAAAPLTLDGTLTVNNGQASMSQNMDGGYTDSAPVSGTLNGIGPVHGVWYESSDSLGDYVGPDTISLQSARGGITIGFSNASPGPAHKDGHSIYYQHAQHSLSASGTYAGEKESGTLQLNENAAHTAVASITLSGS